MRPGVVCRTYASQKVSKFPDIFLYSNITASDTHGGQFWRKFIMGMSICKFHVKGWLSSEPKVVHLLDKDGIEYVSVVIRISIPRIKPDKECTFKQHGYNIISVSVHGSAAEQIEKEAADPSLRWRRGDLVEIRGYLVPTFRRATRGRDFLGRRLTPAYRIRTNNPQNIINYSGHERKRTQHKENPGGISNCKFTTISPGRSALSRKTPLGKAIEVDYHDF